MHTPGVASFYVPFAQHLRHALGPSSCVHVVSHLGHHLRSCHGDTVFSLQQQIQHHQHAIDHLMQLRPGSRLPTFVVGHSIGAHIAIELLRRSPGKVLPRNAHQCLQLASPFHPSRTLTGEPAAYQVCGVVGLFPFLQVDARCWAQSWIAVRLKSAWLVSLTARLAGGVGLLPTRVQRSLLALLGPTGAFSAEAAETLRRALTQTNVVRAPLNICLW